MEFIIIAVDDDVESVEMFDHCEPKVIADIDRPGFKEFRLVEMVVKRKNKQKTQIEGNYLAMKKI